MRFHNVVDIVETVHREKLSRNTQSEFVIENITNNYFRKFKKALVAMIRNA